MKKILISGVGGLLGSKVFKKLENLNYKVFGISHQSSKSNLKNNIIYLDLNTNWSAESLPKNIDIILHLAQSNYHKDFPKRSLDIFNVNVASTAKLLDYAYKKKVKKFIYASTGGLYGPGIKKFKETDKILPAGKLNYYLSSKLSGEILCSNYSSYFKIIIIRPFFIYGFGQKKSMLLPRMYNSIKTKKPITLYGKSGIKINPIHVNDASNAILKCLKLNQRFSIINLAGPEVLSMKTIAETIGNYLGTKPIFNSLNKKSNNLIADISKMRKLLHQPKIKFAQGIDKMF